MVDDDGNEGDGAEHVHEGHQILVHVLHGYGGTRSEILCAASVQGEDEGIDPDSRIMSPSS